MGDKVDAFLSLDTGEARRAWLEEHAPARDEIFLDALREEARRRERDDPHLALRVARGVTDAAVVWSDRQAQALALHLEADARLLLAEHEAALDLYQRAASCYRSLGLEPKAARVAVGQIATLQYLGRYEEALSLAGWAAGVFRASDDQLSLGKILMNRGNIFYRLGRFGQVRDSYAKARAVFDALGDERYLAMVNVNEANVLAELDDFRQAERLLRQARAYFEAQGMASAVARVDHNLAHLYLDQGIYQQALATFNRARQTFDAQDDPVQVAYVDLYRSEIYLALNLWHEALQWARLARPAFEKAGMAWEVGRAWLNEAAALAHLDDDAPPVDALERARQVFVQEQNQIWLAATDLYQATFDWRSGDLNSAREHALRAREAFRRAVQGDGLRSRVAQCEVLLGKVALQEWDIERAADHFSRGLSELEGADLPAIAYECLYGLARNEQRRGRTGAARQYYRQAIVDVECLQATVGAEDYKIAFLSDKLRVYEGLIVLSLDVGTPEAVKEAFATVEQAKSRALLDALAREPATHAGSKAEADLRVEVERLKGELNWYYNRLHQPQPDSDGQSAEVMARLVEAITRREREMRELLDRWHAPDLASAPRNPLWTVTVDQIQAALPDRAMLLEFYTAQDRIILFGLDGETMWVRRLPATRSEVTEALGQLRFQMNKFGYSPDYRQRHASVLRRGADESLQRLYRALLAPVEEALTADVLIVVPHGVLHYVPFHALFDGERYLIDVRTVSYAPSATVLHRTLTRPLEGNGRPPLMLGLADRAIPRAQAEVESIAALFSDADVRVGERATVGSLMENEQRPAFLHLSTHATFRADNPLFSSLKLADGWVSVSDIYGMAGSAPLVTLSACETGRSQVAVGDELVGLCRGFFTAGARSLVVSLWAVDDNSAARLMRRFYGELRAGQPVNQALCAAQRVTKAEMGHPYYWAPFLLTGNANMRLPALAGH
jgi:CHAT domain-containing protein